MRWRNGAPYRPQPPVPRRSEEKVGGAPMEKTIQPASDAMRKAAEDVFKLLYVDHDFQKAGRTHLAPHFIEHNPELPNSPEDQIKWFNERSAAQPDNFAPE